MRTYVKSNFANPLVSIIIPVYGVEDYIGRCARSVFRQTYQNLEIIFVDDCTPDNSIGVLRQVMEEYPERKAQVKILKHEHNRGLSAARNTGMEAATGEYIYFLDSDDSITEECIESLAEPLKKQKYDFVIGSVRLVDFPNPDIMPHLIAAEGPIDNVLSAYNKGLWYSMAYNKMVKRSYLEKNKIFFKEGLIHEDELWSYHLAVTAQSMYVLPKETYTYYNRPGSIMTSRHIDKEIKNLKTIIIETKRIQQNLHLFYYGANKRIDSYQDILFKWLCSGWHYSRRKSYKEIRSLDIRTYSQKWSCYKHTILSLPLNLHWLLPEALGFYWYILVYNLKSKVADFSHKKTLI